MEKVQLNSIEKKMDLNIRKITNHPPSPCVLTSKPLSRELYVLKSINQLQPPKTSVFNITYPVMSLFISRYLKMPKALGEILYQILERVLLL